MKDSRNERPGHLPSKRVVMPEIPWHISKAEWAEQRPGKGLECLQARRGMYRRLQESRESRWAELCSVFEANPDFFNAYHWLENHPAFYYFHAPHGEPVIHEQWLVSNRGMADNSIEFSVVRVDPETDAISDDPALNTQVRFWYEVLVSRWPATRDRDRIHWYTQDGGAASYEAAVIQVAKSFHRKYGNDRRKLDRKGAGPCVTTTS